jgi:hypothetical protein
VVTRLASGELLALACSGRARHALARYRQRWTIETDPPPLKWSTLKYVFWHQGGPNAEEAP